MKKFVSMAMVAAMTVSMVPATAFAAGDVTATAKIVDDLELTKDEASYTIDENNYGTKVPELQLKITDADYRGTNAATSVKEVTLTLDNAKFIDQNGDKKIDLAGEGSYLSGLVSIDYTTEADTDTAVSTAWVPGGTGDVLSPDSDNDPTDELDIAVADLVSKSGLDAVQWLMEDHSTLDWTASVLTDAGVAADIYYDPVDGDGDGDIVKVYDATTNDEFVNGWTAESFVETLFAIADGTDTGVLQTGATDAGTALTGDTKFTLVEIDGSTAVALNTTTMATAFDFDEADMIAGYLTTAGYAQGAYVTSTTTTTVARTPITIQVTDVDEDEVTFEFTGEFMEDDVIIFDLESEMDKTSTNRTATVSVSGDLVEADDLVYATVLGYGMTASTKALTKVAEEEYTVLEKDIKIKSNVGNLPTTLELKVSNGFELRTSATGDGAGTNCTYANDPQNDDVVIVTVAGGVDEITIDAEDIEIEAVSADAGEIATIKVSAPGASSYGKVTFEVAQVVDYNVTMSVEEDEDVPVIYSGVNVANYGITDDSDHMSLEVTIEESFPGAWSMRQGFNFELPEGVYVTDVDVLEAENFKVQGGGDANESHWEDAFWKAYRDGDHKAFEFGKRVFNDVDQQLEEDPASLTFQLELVADPGFVGDVNLKINGDLLDEQEVTIAKFETPFYVTAEQNDLKIDYRYTDIPTEIVITEAEAGLWNGKSGLEAQFQLEIETGNIEFEDDPTFTIDDASNLEIKDEKAKGGKITFKVDDESDEPATVTISDMQLFMNRNIPAGPYDLELGTSMGAGYITEVLFAPDHIGGTTYQARNTYARTSDAIKTAWNIQDVANDIERADITTTIKEDSYIDDVADFSKVVKEAFVNVVTAGREQDDASFTTKVVVPVGESYLVSGENTVDLDVPAYISAAGYTMLPVRAVANGLGISNNNVLWNGETKTVTILYGQRIITMVAGQKVINVNGSAIPASAAVEITDGRAFLPMRDLATALGVTDITWDAATKTATLNGGVQ